MENQSFISKLYEGFVYSGSHLKSIFLLLVRLYFGFAFLFAGFTKFQDLNQTSEFFADLNIPFPFFNTLLASSVEFFGGIFLVLGIGTRFFSFILMLVMLVAMYTAHQSEFLNLFNDSQAFITLVPFIFFFASLTLFVFGPGRVSMDHLFKTDGDIE